MLPASSHLQAASRVLGEECRRGTCLPGIIRQSNAVPTSCRRSPSCSSPLQFNLCFPPQPGPHPPLSSKHTADVPLGHRQQSASSPGAPRQEPGSSARSRAVCDMTSAPLVIRCSLLVSSSVAAGSQLEGGRGTPPCFQVLGV